MMTDRKKTGVAFWATVVMAGLVLYVLSIGPASWLVDRNLLSIPAAENLYWPLFQCPDPVFHSIEWYARLWQRG